MAPLELDKRTATACATALLHPAGVNVAVIQDDRGQRVLVLSRGCWVKQCRPEGVRDALAELARLKLAVPS